MDYLYNLPGTVITAILRAQDRQEGFSRLAARLSLLRDVDRKRIKGMRQYARIWGWTIGRVRYHWPRLWQDVALWCSLNGKCLDHPMVERLPQPWQDWLAEQAEAGSESVSPSRCKQKTAASRREPERRVRPRLSHGSSRPKPGPEEAPITLPSVDLDQKVNSGTCPAGANTRADNQAAPDSQPAAPALVTHGASDVPEELYVGSDTTTHVQHTRQRADPTPCPAKIPLFTSVYADSQRTRPHTNSAPNSTRTTHHTNQTTNRKTERPERDRDLRSRPAERGASSRAPAIEMIIRILHYTPNEIQQELVMQQVENLRVWEDVIRETAEHGWRRSNVPRMLESYRYRITGVTGETNDLPAIMDPAVLFERNRAIARKALGLDPDTKKPGTVQGP